MIPLLWCILAASCLVRASRVDVDNNAGSDEIDPDTISSKTTESDSFLGNDDVNIRLVHVLFRHGDRSPTRTYKNDLYTEADWPQGFGQLSSTGMKQEWQLGQFMRNKYVNDLGFLSKDYVRTEVYARSTTLDRALMSAQSFLAGLYPTNDDNWSADIAWQPIPVHTQVNVSDYLLSTNTPCPEANAAMQDFPETDINVQKILKNYSEFFKNVSENSGEPNTWDGIIPVIDPLFCQRTSGKALPDWVTDEVYDKLLELRDINTGLPRPKKQLRLRSGPLLKEMIEHMVNKTIHDELMEDKKLFIYSAHDSTIISFLKLLGLFNSRAPPYSACVIVELLESKQTEGDFYVQLSYRNETDAEPYLLTIDECDNGEKCPLKQFVNLYKDQLPVDIKRECGLDDNSNINKYTGDGENEEFSKTSTVLNVILLFLLLTLIIGMAVFMLFQRDKSRDSSDYSPVPTEMLDIA